MHGGVTEYADVLTVGSALSPSMFGARAKVRRRGNLSTEARKISSLHMYVLHCVLQQTVKK
jgi:hypothetical protein